MTVKTLQIALVVVAVLCAVGIASLLAGRDAAMPHGFRPPPWISALEGLAPRPTVTRSDLTQAGRPFPRELKILSGVERYSIQPDPDNRVRQLDFDVTGRELVIRYQNPEEEQRWPSREYPDEEPSFIVYKTGGTMVFTVEAGGATVRIKE